MSLPQRTPRSALRKLGFLDQSENAKEALEKVFRDCGYPSLTMIEIAENLGVGYNTARRWQKMIGLPTPKRKWRRNR